MNERTKISVAVITYNQQDTIRQTLDSILMQKGDFDIELVIGEDCSQDSTYAICVEYAEKYPNTVKLLPNTHNLGIMANFARVIHACSGELIADIAGDDYYCDDHALEKQMTYMLSHPKVGVMAANGYLYYIRRNKKVPGLNPVFDSDQKMIRSYYFSPTHFEGVYLAPVGILYRSDLFKKYIDFDEIVRRKLPVEDYPIQAILSQHTHFACLPDLLVTYRVYKESASYISYNHPRFLEYYQGLMETRRYLNELFPSDAIAEDLLKEKMFSKEFSYYVYNMKYQEAKQLIASVPQSITSTSSVRTAKQYTQNWLRFVAYHIYKKIITHMSIRKVV